MILAGIASRLGMGTVKDPLVSTRDVAWVAALTSFSLFAVGAAIPLIPFTVVTGLGAVVAATTLACLTLAGIGAAITVVTGQPALRSALRQLAFGVIAAAITYGLGRLLGTAIG